MNVSCKQQQETGPAAIGSSYYRWIVDDGFPCRSLSSQRKDESLCSEDYFKLGALSGCGGVINAGQQLSKLTHLFLPRTKPTTVELTSTNLCQQ